MKIYSQQKNKGFTLIETLVAISIFTMSILGLLSILASGISNTNYAKQKMAATYLAQEGIEYARNVRDNKVLSGSWGNFYNLPNDSAEINPPAPSDSNFIRTVSKIPVGTTGDEVKISSTVKCTKCSNGYTITLSEDLFNWVE